MNRTCECLCGEWKHDPAECEGQATGKLIAAAGNVLIRLRMCIGCATAIALVTPPITDRRLLD
jgi:hypothetical protein